MQTILGPTGMALLNGPAGFQVNNRTVYVTPGTFTFTPAKATRLLFIEVLGSGGGAPGVSATAGNAAVSTGANSGAYANALRSVGSSPYTVVVAAGAAGTVGSPSSVTNNAGTVICNGGGGRSASTLSSGSTEAFQFGSTLINSAAIGDITGFQSMGSHGYRQSATLVFAGKGGNSILGGGGNALTATSGNNPGNTGGKYGAGASGNYSINGAGISGTVAGGGGFVIIWEFE